MNRTIKSRQSHWLFLGVLLLLIPSAAMAQKTNYFRNQYVCSGELRATTKKHVTCVENDLSKCSANQVVIHPRCSTACKGVLKREGTNCFMKRSQKWRICKAQTIPDSTQKSGKSCGKVFLEFRSKCGNSTKSSKKQCVLKAKNLLPNCHSQFHKAVVACKAKRVQVGKACQYRHKGRLGSCAGRRSSRRKNTVGYCQRLFWGCSM